MIWLAQADLPSPTNPMARPFTLVVGMSSGFSVSFPPGLAGRPVSIEGWWAAGLLEEFPSAPNPDAADPQPLIRRFVHRFPPPASRHLPPDLEHTMTLRGPCVSETCPPRPGIASVSIRSERLTASRP